ncbi:tryptophan 2,3-dioxygenase [Aliiruegeria lutimaris]|uniref:Tryptophan 2,3-dioxygenase n=1 Tax=Aliiruegeria lutimaris TaxID=571298 RepID=A0A1G9BLX0_9RHOB|nr:tryptophan 2,3-dioxygenase family protein [Aliiruegeria lutimaris]SDK40518.1 tryptophan 2,3-dioxygenase [Aliiruegeria lutimaris]
MADTSEFSYGSHLQLDKLLSTQVPVSGRHDELLFIIQHQTSELWFRLVLAEIDAARSRLKAGDLRGALKALKRVAVVLYHLVQSWEVLRQLDPVDFLSFRGDLGEASGFQSWQYRLLEFALGNRERHMLDAHRDRPEAIAQLEAELSRPSLYQECLIVLDAGIGAEIPIEALVPGGGYEQQQAVLDGWAVVYRDRARHAELYDLAEQLIEIEDRFRCWRFNHVTTVERVIGAKGGTGGTSGVHYLRRMLDVVLFPELWEVRTVL